VLLVVGLGLLAAFLFAGSASLQQHAAQGTDYAPEVGRSVRRRGRPVVLPALLALVRKLVRKPLWLLGWLTNLVGFLVQATALHFGSVALVQPLLVTQLLFALPMASACGRTGVTGCPESPSAAALPCSWRCGGWRRWRALPTGDGWSWPVCPRSARWAC
jgi:drug/metabolite transporter (DMT)-like permease